MPPTSQDFKISFSIDLAPYAAGLKTMLTMTQQTGQQIVPLLNLQIAAPNTAIFDQQIAKLNAELQQLEDSQAKVAAGAQGVGTAEAQAGSQIASQTAPAIDNLTKKNIAAAGAGDGHSESLRGMRREFGHIFGAIGFVTVSLTELAAHSGASSQEVQKFASSMEKGVTAGFGMMMGMQALGFAMTGTTMGISALVAVGLSLLTFFDNAEEKAKKMSAAMESFVSGLRGADVEQLEFIRDQLQKTIGAEQAEAERLRQVRALLLEANPDPNSPNIITVIGDLKKVTTSWEGHKAELDKINSDITAHRMSEVEGRKEIDKIEVDNISGKYAKERAEADKQLADERQKIKDSAANEDTKGRLVYEAWLRWTNRHNQIDFDQVSARDAQEKTIRDISLSTAKIVIDIEEKKELATAKTEISKVAITEKYGLARLKIEEDDAIKSLKIEKKRLADLGGPDAVEKIKQIEKQQAAIRDEFSAKRAQVRTESNVKVEEMPLGSVLEQQDNVKSATETFNRAITDDARRAAKEQLDIEKRKYEEMVAAYPVGSILAEQLKVQEAQKDLDNAIPGIAQESARKQLKIEQDKLEKMKMSNEEYYKWRKQKEDEQRKVWEDTHQVAMIAINSTTDGFRGMWDEFAIDHRQAKNGWDAGWLAMKNSAMKSLGELLANEIKNQLVSVGIHQTAEGAKTAATEEGVAARIALLGAEIVKDLASAAASIVGAIAKAIEWEVSIFGPFAIATIPASIAAMVGVYEGVKSALGFEQGGKIRKGQRGYFEGNQTEIIAPEKTFYQVANEEILPSMLRSLSRMPTLPKAMTERLQQERQSAPGASTRALEQRMDRMVKAVESLGGVEFVQRGDDLYGTWRRADRKYKLLKL